MLLQIAPSAKKLWGVEEPKDEPKGILSLNDHQMWRDSTWSTSACTPELRHVLTSALLQTYPRYPPPVHHQNHVAASCRLSSL
ncbi:hypothetical protein J6590_049084 [Homalodisca vitripennis]|nr:hypothetical protein J6590_049084 [Homalodisca vitripennis]